MAPQAWSLLASLDGTGGAAMEMIVVSDEADRKRGMRVSRGGDRRARPPRVERPRSPRSTLVVSAPPDSAGGGLFDVVASVIAIAVLIGMLVLPAK
jgi:hypothetical protein